MPPSDENFAQAERLNTAKAAAMTAAMSAALFACRRRNITLSYCAGLAGGAARSFCSRHGPGSTGRRLASGAIVGR
jgi:hypothetical protein